VPCGTAPAVVRRPGLLLVDARPLVRRLVAEMLDDLRLYAAEAEDTTQAEGLLDTVEDAGAGDEASVLLVVAVRHGRGLSDGRALAAELVRRRPAARPPGVIYTGEHASVLGGEALDARERFLAEPFGRTALARAVYGLRGRPVPRWLQDRTMAGRA
jgi:hypothetical protein